MPHDHFLQFQVPLLLSIGEEDTALIKATESGDTDLVYLVIFHIWQKVYDCFICDVILQLLICILC